MLSFIYRLYRDFEQQMGYAPNVLFNNAARLASLRESFAGASQCQLAAQRQPRGRLNSQ